MYTALTIIIIIVSILLALVVLIQNPKGGGIVSGIIGSSQVMGVKKTSDFIEKLTWGLAISLVVLCLTASFSLPGTEERSIGSSMQEQIESSAAPINVPAPAPAQQQPAAPPSGEGN
jgi:preprotein translocase subunit SecG